MLIVGAGNFALDFLTSIELESDFPQLTFFAEENQFIADVLKNNFLILNNKDELLKYFKNKDKNFLVAVGNNEQRQRIAKEIIALGGVYSTYISSYARIAKFSKISKKGVIIMHDSLIGNEVEIGEGNIIYPQCQIGHFSKVGNYNLISSQFLTSSIHIGNYNTIGFGSVAKPSITIEDNCIIGIGSVVTKNVESNSIIKGNPAS